MSYSYMYSRLVLDSHQFFELTTFLLAADDILPPLESNKLNQWKKYVGKSLDNCFTYVYIKRTAEKEKKHYKCRIYNQIRAVGNGPSNIRRHLLRHNFHDSLAAYDDYKRQTALKQSQCAGIKFRVRKVRRNSTKQNEFVDLCVD